MANIDNLPQNTLHKVCPYQCIWLGDCPDHNDVFRWSPARPESKMVLMMMLAKFGGKEETGPVTIRELCVCTGASSKVLQQAVSDLVMLGLLQKEAVPSAKGGTTFTYRFLSNGSEQYARKCADRYPQHFELLIKELLSDALDPGESERRHPLNLSARLLLITLLAHADACGVVRGLSKGDICRITGVTSTRLRSQFNVLKQHGYLGRSIHGGTIRQVFGKTPSVYHLNVTCNKYIHRIPMIQIAIRAEAPQVLTGFMSLTNSTRRLSDERKSNEPFYSNHEVHMAFIELCRLWQAMDHQILIGKLLWNYFSFTSALKNQAFLLEKIRGYVSLLMTKAWGQLGKESVPGEVREMVTAFIAKECFGTKSVSYNPPSALSRPFEELIHSNGIHPEVYGKLEEDKQLVVDFLFLLSHEISKRLRQRLSKCPVDSDMHFALTGYIGSRQTQVIVLARPPKGHADIGQPVYALHEGSEPVDVTAKLKPQPPEG